MDGSGQQFVCTFGALFWQVCSAENIVRFAYQISQRLEIIFLSHAATVTSPWNDCKGLLFSSTQF